MRKISFESKLTIKDIVILAVIILGLCLLIRQVSAYIVAIIILVLVGIFESITKKEPYLSEIILFDSFFEIIYKQNQTICEKVNVRKSEIKQFHLEISVLEQADKITSTGINGIITLKNGEKVEFWTQTSATEIKPSRMLKSTIHPIIELAKAQRDYDFPNFTYSITGSTYTKRLFEHYLENDKLSFSDHLA